MLRRQFLSLALLPLAACAHKPIAKSNSKTQQLATHLEKILPALMAEHKVPGVGIAIVENAQLTWRGSFGLKNAATKIPVDHQTIFEAGSMSKPVFACVILKLCEKGILNLDTPLTKYTSEKILNDPRADQITPRHILSHTSGLQNWRSAAEPLKIHFTPGESWLYSGEGYYWLQSILTQLLGHTDPTQCATYEADLKVCATDIAGFMSENILNPFAMTHSGYITSPAYTLHTSRGHDKQGQPLPERNPRPSDAARYASAGGLHCTPTDYAKFLIEILNPKRPDNFRLKKETLEEMLRPQIKIPNDPYEASWALGWQITKTGLFQHGGDNPGFHSFALASAKLKNAFVIMTNADDGPALMGKIFTTQPLTNFFET